MEFGNHHSTIIMTDNTPFPPGKRLPLGADRRSEPRRLCVLEVSCQPITAKACDLWWLAEIRDVSVHGVGMISTRRFERGTYIAIQIANLANDFMKMKVARVAHVAPCRDKWFVGCSFQTPLHADEIDAMAGAVSAGASSS
jgi:hypothetical protein